MSAGYFSTALSCPFMDKGCGLKCLPRALLGHLLAGQFPQLAIHERQELVGGVPVAFICGGEDSGEFAHGGPLSSRGRWDAPHYRWAAHRIHSSPGYRADWSRGRDELRRAECSIPQTRGRMCFRTCSTSDRRSREEQKATERSACLDVGEIQPHRSRSSYLPSDAAVSPPCEGPEP